MNDTLKTRLADRRVRNLIVTLTALLLVLSAIGILLYTRVNTLLNRYMEVQGEKQAETLSELTHRQFEVEMTALRTVAGELPQIEGMRASALRAMQDSDPVGRIGVQRIDGLPYFGEAYDLNDFPCIESAVHGENAMSYCPGKGLMFCVPALRGENVAYVVYRLYPESALYERFGVVSYSGSGRARIEDASGAVVVDAQDANANEPLLFDAPGVREGVERLESEIYESGGACLFRKSDSGEVMLYAAPIEGTDYHVVGYVPKSVVMEGVHHISDMVLFVFSMLSAVVLLGGFLLVDAERQSRQRDSLREAARIAEKSSAAKSEFLANMSHDIRTPMNAIIGFTNLALRDAASPEEMRTNLGKIRSASSSLLDLINDILEMSRLESGAVELHETVCSLPELFTELEDLLSGPAGEKHQHFTTDCSGLTHRSVWCDRTQLRRVLLNLVGNAVKFTPEGGEISLSAQQLSSPLPDRARYELRVKDNGIGMSQEFAPRAFTLFERERTSTVSGMQGSGLGLAIVKNIVDSCGGTVRVETAQGVGSEFIVTLDLRPVSAEELRAEDQMPAASSQAAKAEPDAPDRADALSAPDGSSSSGVAAATDAEPAAPFSDPADASTDEGDTLAGRRILLVDDIELNREIASMVLEMMDLEVEQACDGSEAVALVQLAEPGYYDAVLMDIQMPVMDGYAATRAIRAMDGARGALPIIALSANAFDEDRKRSAEAGMNAHLAKPLDADELERTLRSILAR